MKLILQILLILLIAATISICAFQPEMHKNVIVYNSDYTLVPEEEVKTETVDVPVMEMPTAQTTTVISETIVKPEVKTVKTKPIKTVTKPKTNVTKTTTTSVKKQNATRTQTTAPQTKTAPKQTVQTVKTVTAPKRETKKAETVITVPVKTVETKTTAPKVLTSQEETIAWNRWRSNLMNQIMQDTKLPDIPTGTVFQFSFNVDKYGKISNVRTGAIPANYTPYAIQYIAPVIRSYQGRSILNFPTGTARLSTAVTGKWRISNTQKYSTPQDYNDYEHVTRY